MPPERTRSGIAAVIASADDLGAAARPGPIRPGTREGVFQERPWRLETERGELRAYTFTPRTVRTVGLAVCSPIGPGRKEDERREVLLARSLAAAGTPVVRFDIRSEGESDGRPGEVDHASYVEDALVAAAVLVRASGAPVGATLGSQLSGGAALAAARALGADDVVLWDPVASGDAYRKAFGRAARIARIAADGPRTSLGEGRDGWLDVFGFPVPEAFLEELTTVLSAPFGGRVLVCAGSRTGSPPREVEAVVDGLRRAGAAVAVELVPGEIGWWYHRYQVEERWAVGRAFRDATLRHLQDLPAVDPRPVPQLPPAPAPPGATETAFVTVGDHELRLEVDRPTDPIPGLGVVVAWGANYGTPAGRHQHLRQLGRRLAELGVPVVRFSWRGVGESSGIADEFDLANPFVDDLEAVCRWFAAQGVARPVIVGQCFGGRSALGLRGAQPRALLLASVPLRDLKTDAPPAPPPPSAARELLRRAPGARTAVLWARGQARALRPRPAAPGRQGRVSERLVRDLEHHLRGGVPIRLVFGQGDPETVDYEVAAAAGTWPFSGGVPGLTTATIGEAVHAAYSTDAVLAIVDQLFDDVVAVLGLRGAG